MVRKKKGLTEYYRRKMKYEDIAEWAISNREELERQEFLVKQYDPAHPDEETFYLKLTFFKK